jgi:hypothetical protein
VQAFSSDPACAHNSYAEATITVHLLP